MPEEMTTLHANQDQNVRLNRSKLPSHLLTKILVALTSKTGRTRWNQETRTKQETDVERKETGGKYRLTETDTTRIGRRGNGLTCSPVSRFALPTRCCLTSPYIADGCNLTSPLLVPQRRRGRPLPLPRLLPRGPFTASSFRACTPALSTAAFPASFSILGAGAFRTQRS